MNRLLWRKIVAMKKCLYLYGAGKWGRAFLESEEYKGIKGNYANIIFYDSNKEINGSIQNINIAHDLWDNRDDKDIIITCGSWYEVYEDCILHDCKPMYIFDRDSSKLLSYMQMCLSKHVLYRNMECIHYEAVREKQINDGVERFKKTNDLFNNIEGVGLMLSNLCNYAYLHSKCPAHCIREKEILSSETVKRIIDELAVRKFDGVLYFHIYNEPMNDPRLFLFIEYAKKEMPQCKVLVYSNGYYLNQVMINDLEEIGADILAVTGYGREEYKRLLALDVNIPYRIVWGDLDERLDLYKASTDDGNREYEPCRTFITTVNIYSDGDVGICCLDYKHPYKLGNIMDNSLEKVLNHERVINIQKNLLNGNRCDLPICRHCNWIR